MKGNREKASKILKNLDKLFSYAEHNQHSDVINLLVFNLKNLFLDAYTCLLSEKNWVLNKIKL